MRGQRLSGHWKSVVCVTAGIFLYLMAELVQAGGPDAAKGELLRNPTGGGERLYQFSVEGFEEGELPVSLAVPERKLSREQFAAAVGEALALLNERILGENPSLREVREDLRLVQELPEFGLSASWESASPEMISDQGFILSEEPPAKGTEVILQVRLSNGLYEETAEIPVTLFPKELTAGERFERELEELVLRDPQADLVRLPTEFEGKRLTYQTPKDRGNLVLIFLGIAAALCLPLKEKSDREKDRKRREEAFLLYYPELVSRFLILTGAGYPVKQAWKKQVADAHKSPKKAVHPVYEEMEVTLNQMETGMPEARAYGEFGRRVGLRPYVKLVSLLESSLQVGGKNLRVHLEAEMEEALKQRRDLARRKGEEASTKLLLPMFLMLGIVMVLVVAPAFLTLT